MKPITREEQYLNKLTGEEQSIAEPITREEQYLSRLCGADNIIPQKPETRREAYLAALCGEEVETPEPVTRIEQYMNFAAGKSQNKPEKAITREEIYWDKYQGGAVPEEKTVQGDIIHITDATGDNAVALSVALAPTQDGTPWISSTLNTEPYLQRAAQNGNTADETIVGGTVAWNQLIDKAKYESQTEKTKSGITFTVNSDGSVTANGTATDTVVFEFGKIEPRMVINHKYLLKSEFTKVGSKDTYELMILRGGSSSGTNMNLYNAYIIDSFQNTDTIQDQLARLVVRRGATITNLKCVPQLTDLTLMFGSAIADYVYSLETATTGAGVAWLKTHGFIDDNYHAYNTGELISAKPTAKTVGATTYALGGADLRGLFKLDEGNNLYCDGDVYTSDGTITRNFGIVDLGTLSYTYYTSGYARFYAQFNDIKVSDELATAHTFGMINDAGFKAELQDTTIPVSDVPTYMSGKDNVVWTVNTANGYHGINFICSEYTSAESFKTAMTGKYLVYELATATTEASTAYTNPQKAGEAEAFVDSRSEKVPVGHSTRYSAEYDINGFEGVTVHVSETQTGGTTYPVTFTSQGTVYGGTIDVVSGEMSIEYIRKTNPTVWQFDSQNNVAIIKIHSYYSVDSNQPECWSNRYEYKGKTTNLASMPDKSCAIYFSYIAIRDSRFTSAEVAGEMLQGTEFVARITPTISATIDPTTIELNEGENYVWTEEGTTTLTYMARAAQRVLAMNKALQKNLKSIELKKGGDVK